jgi:hypothetical protein
MNTKDSAAPLGDALNYCDEVTAARTAPTSRVPATIAMAAPANRTKVRIWRWRGSMTSAFQSTLASDQKRSGLIAMINPHASTTADKMIQKISMPHLLPMF